MIISEDDYLEHFGVRGMHWGVRKNRSPKSKKVKKTYGPAKLTKGEIARSLSAGAGAAYVLAHLDANTSETIRSFDSFVVRHGAKAVNRIVKTVGAMRVKDMVVFAPGKFTPGMFRDAGPRALGAGVKALTA